MAHFVSISGHKNGGHFTRYAGKITANSINPTAKNGQLVTESAFAFNAWYLGVLYIINRPSIRWEFIESQVLINGNVKEINRLPSNKSMSLKGFPSKRLQRDPLTTHPPADESKTFIFLRFSALYSHEIPTSGIIWIQHVLYWYANQSSNYDEGKR